MNNKPDLPILPHNLDDHIRYTWNSTTEVYTIRRGEWVKKGETTAIAEMFATANQQQDEANVKFIVNSCNNYQKTLHALKYCRKRIYDGKDGEADEILADLSNVIRQVLKQLNE